MHRPALFPSLFQRCTQTGQIAHYGIPNYFVGHALILVAQHIADSAHWRTIFSQQTPECIRLQAAGSFGQYLELPFDCGTRLGVLLLSHKVDSNHELFNALDRHQHVLDRCDILVCGQVDATAQQPFQTSLRPPQ